MSMGYGFEPRCLSCGLDIISLAGEWLTAAANTNMFTYEIAPVFILMENVVLEKMREIIGWNCGDSILAPGGSISNLYAFLAARHHKFPQYKEKGLTSIPGHLVMFTSDQVSENELFTSPMRQPPIWRSPTRKTVVCHYSVKSCASVCGLGTDYCVMVPSDERGRMLPSQLERLVRYHKDRGHVPFFVNATSGTTVLGAFDPLPEIADICQKYDMWMHVDAAWGGGLLFSKKYRHPRLTGIESLLMSAIYIYVFACVTVFVVLHDHRASATPTHCAGARLYMLHLEKSGSVVSINLIVSPSSSVSLSVCLSSYPRPSSEVLSRKLQFGMNIPRLTTLTKGADSVTWNPHKLMGTLLQCSTVHFKYESRNDRSNESSSLSTTAPPYSGLSEFITEGREFRGSTYERGGGVLLSCNAMSAEYLFMTDKIYDPRYDTGDKVIQCGRHNDIFKLWLQWRAKGTLGFERLMDRLMELSEYMVRRLKEQPDKFYLILEPEMVNVSFWYLPEQLRGVHHDSAKELKLGKVCAELKGRMMRAGTLMIGYQPDERRPNFFRSIISSAAVTERDVDFMLSEMDRLGHDIKID
ncbi:Glutamate decarboxylase [Eumeta japonica]|uniref:Glutamate decarboxylase n=1 Tax=Eumeta variegata TaxID=151549 RepID=A0A4C1YR86_EUMVA|nr:Glutamate decarboxylase [Eumeta japonica]